MTTQTLLQLITTHPLVLRLTIVAIVASVLPIAIFVAEWLGKIRRGGDRRSVKRIDYRLSV